LRTTLDTMDDNSGMETEGQSEDEKDVEDVEEDIEEDEDDDEDEDEDMDLDKDKADLTDSTPLRKRQMSSENEQNSQSRRYFVRIHPDRVNIIDCEDLKKRQKDPLSGTSKAMSDMVHTAKFLGSTSFHDDDSDSEELPLAPAPKRKRDNNYDTDDPFIDDHEAIDIRNDDSHDAETKYFVHASSTGALTDCKNPVNVLVPRKKKRKTLAALLPSPVTDALNKLKSKYTEVMEGEDGRPRAIPSSLDNLLYNVESRRRSMGNERPKQKRFWDSLQQVLPWKLQTLKSRMKTLFESKRASHLREEVEKVTLQLKENIKVEIGVILDKKNARSDQDTSKVRPRWKILADDLVKVVDLKKQETTAMNHSLTKNNKIDVKGVVIKLLKEIAALWPAECDVTYTHLRSVYKRYSKKDSKQVGKTASAHLNSPTPSTPSGAKRIPSSSLRTAGRSESKKSAAKTNAKIEKKRATSTKGKGNLRSMNLLKLPKKPWLPLYFPT